MTALRRLTATALLLLIAALALAEPADNAQVRVGTLVYDDGKKSVCFADDFLDTVARQSDVNLARRFQEVELASEALFEHPFVVMTGEDSFSLSDEEKRNLKAYLERGGFLLASAGCSNRAWANSFEAVVRELFGEEAMQELSTEHPLFHTLYDIDRIAVRKHGATPAMYGLTLDGTVRMVYSPLGLNDTANAGEGCCCCGGNELRNARQINANILAYALTH